MAAILLSEYVDESIAELHGNGATGIIEIHNLDQLARVSALGSGELTSHEDTFEDGAIFAPWPTTLRALKALCQRDPRPALEMLGQRRADQKQFAMRVAASGDPWWWEEDAGDQALLAKRLRQWHGIGIESTRFLQVLLDAETPTLTEDFLELREMYIDLVRIMPDAIARVRMVRAQISENLADELQRLIDRALPRSSELLGAEPPAENSV